MSDEDHCPVVVLREKDGRGVIGQLQDTDPDGKKVVLHYPLFYSMTESGHRKYHMVFTATKWGLAPSMTLFNPEQMLEANDQIERLYRSALPSFKNAPEPEIAFSVQHT